MSDVREMIEGEWDPPRSWKDSLAVGSPILIRCFQLKILLSGLEKECIHVTENVLSVIDQIVQHRHLLSPFTAHMNLGTTDRILHSDVLFPDVFDTVAESLAGNELIDCILDGLFAFRNSPGLADRDDLVTQSPGNRENVGRTD